MRHRQVLVILDYNGTIVEHNKVEVESEVFKGLMDIKSKVPVKFLIVTGRPQELVDKKIMYVADYIAFEDGAYIIDSSGRIVFEYHNTLWNVIKESFIDVLGKPLFNCKVILVYPLRLKRRIQMLTVKLKVEDIVRVAINRDKVIVEPREIGKGFAIKYVIELLNPVKIIGCGDGEIDIEIFKHSHIKIAPYNACRKVKNLADIIADKPNGVGIIDCLRKILLV